MTAFSFSSGDPTHLTSGTNALMSDISGPFADIKARLNSSGLFDTTDLSPTAGITDGQLASPNNAVWTSVVGLDYRNGIAGLSTTPCYVGSNTIVPSGTGALGISGLWVPPTSTDIAVAGKITRLRVRACYAPNAVAPGITLTWGLYPITALGGVVSSQVVPTLGTVIAGSTAAVVSPPASQTGEAKSGSFDFSLVAPPSGYVIGLVGSGAQAANSLLGCTAYLEMRHT